jgi:outer membrane lipopolysaccharide assembly protein LptE/RlpB
MISSTFRRLSLISAVALAVAACGSHMKGKYASSNGMMSVEFRGDKAYVTVPMAGTQQMDFEQDGDRVILKNEGGNLVLTRNSDGSLSGPMGDMKPVDD